MSGRVGTVYGTAGVDAINPDYVDGSGQSIWMFSDDNLPGNLPDRVIVAAGDATTPSISKATGRIGTACGTTSLSSLPARVTTKSRSLVPCFPGNPARR
ncbi:hypothetical protein [Paracoccus sphaerophysae]|uniref:hypothetical protein n=1 Tax=Paracoccus sphaerophysae TaxID=690417 RepID=UPI0012EC13E5|nr:hypothetical protein [Paracoccus sphaerophysae]